MTKSVTSSLPRGRTLSSLWVLILILTACLPAFGQNGNATVTGTVTDQTGAVIPGANVAITNTATGVINKVVSDKAGLYFIPNLIPGTYNLDATANGMKGEHFVGLRLDVDQQARLDAQLQIGATSTLVEVNAGSATLLQLEDASVGTVVGTAQVQQLPLNGRFITQLLELAPGTVPSSYSNNLSHAGNPQLTGAERNGQPAFDIAGQNGGATYFRLDGLENNERSFGGANIALSVDAVQEFKVQTSNFSAEFGRSSAQVDVVSRSGTSEFHGGLFEFLRNDVFDAAQWVYNANNVKNDLKRNQFGGVIGGPILKHKLFFFFSTDFTRQVYVDPILETVPTVAMRQGTFPSGEVIFNPATQQPFQNNTIPSSTWNSISSAILPFIPMPNLPGSPNTSQAGLPLPPTNNYLYKPSRTQNVNQYNIRVDYTRNEKNTYFGRYTYNSNNIIGDGPLATNLNGSIIGSEVANLSGTNLTGGWTHIFSSNTINQVFGGYSTDPQNYAKGDNTNYAAQFGLSGQLFPNAFPGFPHVTIGPTVLGSGDNRPLQAQETDLEASDYLTMVRGAHSIRVGGNARRVLMLTSNNQSSTGVFTFNGVQTRDRAFPATGTTSCPGNASPTSCQAGDAMADFLLGDLSGDTRGTPIEPIHKYYSNYALFANDTWRMRPNLTIELGLRYEYETRNHASPPFNSQPLFDNNQPFAAGTGFGFTGVIAVANNSDGSPSSLIIPGAPEMIPGSVETCRSAGLPDNCAISQKNGWQPRFGFNWQVHPTTVLRGGFGIFFGSFFGDSDLETNQSFPIVLTQSIATFTAPPSGTAPPPINFSNAFSGATLAKPTYTQSSPPLRQLPQIDEWNLTLQQSFGDRMALTVGYVGSVSHHLDQSVVGTQSATNIPAPWGIVLAPGQTQKVPFPAFSTVAPYLQVDNANYNALQVLVEKHMSHGIQFTGAYTWAKNMGTRSWLTDPRNYRLDYGPLNNDLRNVIAISPIWALPFGKGQRFAPSNRVANALVEGWNASTIFSWHSGFPFNPQMSGTDVLHLNGHHSFDKPDQACSGSLPRPSPQQWYDGTCFVFPTEPTTPGASLHEGNVGLNNLHGPRTTTQDFGLSKANQITDRLAAEFRVEAFNLWNHTILGLPNFSNSPFSTPNTRITYVDETPRTIQLALKVHF
jgi:hypothetical protein